MVKKTKCIIFYSENIYSKKIITTIYKSKLFLIIFVKQTLSCYDNTFNIKVIVCATGLYFVLSSFCGSFFAIKTWL